MTLSFLQSDAMIWTSLAVLGLMCAAFGAVATLPAPDRRAGSGARHRAPGLPTMVRSGTYPRRRDEGLYVQMIGRAQRPTARIPAPVLIRGVLLDLGRRAGMR